MQMILFRLSSKIARHKKNKISKKDINFKK